MCFGLCKKKEKREPFQATLSEQKRMRHARHLDRARDGKRNWSHSSVSSDGREFDGVEEAPIRGYEGMMRGHPERRQRGPRTIIVPMPQ
ncbi:hypothetical protein ACHAPA_004543 [Fusarium lateritium]